MTYQVSGKTLVARVEHLLLLLLLMQSYEV